MTTPRSPTPAAIDYTDAPHPYTLDRLEHRAAAPPHTADEHVGFNGWLAKTITTGIGNMWAFYAFALAMALWMIGAGEAIFGDPYPWSLMLLIFGGILQMLLMIAIMVGQQVLGGAADKRADMTYRDAGDVGAVGMVARVRSGDAGAASWCSRCWSASSVRWSWRRLPARGEATVRSRGSTRRAVRRMRR